MAHMRQSGPESSLGFQAKVLKPFYVVLSSLGSGHVSPRANVAYIRLSRPDPGLGFQVKVLQTFQVVSSKHAAGKHRGWCEGGGMGGNT
jgi:hypothetical protein